MSGAAALLAELKLSSRRPFWAATGNRPPGRLILAGFLLAGTGFICVTLVSAYRLRQVSVESADINANVFPRVVAVATVRERVRELMTQVDLAVDSRDGALAGFDRLTSQALDEEAELKTSEGVDTQDLLRARHEISVVVEAAQRVRDRLLAGEAHEARSLVDSTLRPAAASADRQLWHLQDQIASAGMQAARRIERVRRSTMLLSFALDAFCMAITAAFAAVTVGAVRRYTRLVEERAHELEQFAARVAHDIRSPLSPVLFALQATSRVVPIEDAHRSILDRAIRSMGRVTTLIDDLFAFAKAGGAIDRSERAKVFEVTRAVVDDARSQAEARGIELLLEAPETALTVVCPSGVLMSLVSNLVRNAIKYMGMVRERRVVVRISQPGGDVRIEVTDTGPGLPADAAEKVFEPYVRADRTGEPGLGLGLATVKRFATAYGGRVGVRSTGEGCTFWFELPRGETT